MSRDCPQSLGLGRKSGIPFDSGAVVVQNVMSLFQRWREEGEETGGRVVGGGEGGYVALGWPDCLDTLRSTARTRTFYGPSK